MMASPADYVVILSRLQFAITTLFHILWPVLTIGLSLFLVVTESLWLRTGDIAWYHHTRFWGRLFLLNFTVGVVTGLPLEFEFGTNWAGFSTTAGGFFGNVLGFEGAMAFMLEAGFLGIMMFGWQRVPPAMHLIATTMVAFGASMSAFWILVANSWTRNLVLAGPLPRYGYRCCVNGIVSAFMDRIDPRDLLGLLDRLDVEVNHDCFVVAAHKNTFEWLILARINFLVRHERRHIDKIARSSLCRELKPLAPAHACLAAHHIDDAFQLAVMVRARLGVGLNAHRACPEFPRTDAGKIDGGFAVHTW
jgi:Cytochrome bd terminal oxidase subunit I